MEEKLKIVLAEYGVSKKILDTLINIFLTNKIKDSFNKRDGKLYAYKYIKTS